jgi:flagellar biosynthesis component FlhA
LSPDTLQKALADIGPEVLKTVEAQAAVDAVQALYSAFYADVVAQKLSEKELDHVLRALSSAILRGLPQ